MTSLKRILTFSGLIGLLGALAFAVPAGANLKASCVVDGDAKAHTTKPSFKKYVQLIGGHGTYRFEANVVCLDLGKGKAPLTTHTGRLVATGTFKQEIVLKNDPNETPFQTPCGISKITGQIRDQTLGQKFNVLVNKKFAIQLGPPIGQGRFFWHHAGPAPKDSGGDLKRFRSSLEGVGGKPAAKPYRYAGDITVAAADPNDKDPVEDLAKREVAGTEDKCTKAFHVNGNVIVHESNPI